VLLREKAGASRARAQRLGGRAYKRIDGDSDPYLCVFIFEMRDGLIAKETGYWSKPFPAPDWRAPWVEMME
jgi:hypothetical protein